MITVLLSGGLGNQLFQYALGRSLSLKHHTSLTLDLGYLNSKLQLDQLATYRRYELDVFELPVLTTDLIFTGKFLYPFAKAEHRLRKFILKKKHQYILEDRSGWDQQVMQAPDDSFLEGFFQSEKYFQTASDTIRADLAFKKTLSGKNAELSREILSRNSISLHIRRGDYIRLKYNLQKHGITPFSYYEAAISEMKSRFHDAHYYIFSDDPAWVRDNMQPDIPYTLADANQTADTAWIDMQLMSQCRHHIICNSTFSWWGAWLNARPDKVVIAPRQWFVDPSINATHILPDSWIKL
jgi:Glycosyl transferase family 11